MRQKAAIILTTLAVLLFSAAAAQAQTFTTLYNFTGRGGAFPDATVIQDKAGNLYGTTSSGGAFDHGAVYELSSTGAETVLHDFHGGSSDGEIPEAPVLRDDTGSLYGTTVGGGPLGAGTVYKVDSAGNESILYSFTEGTDGCSPYQGLVMDDSGNLYGTTGTCFYDYGTVFELTQSGTLTVLHTFAGGSADGKDPEYGRLLMDGKGDLYGLTTYGGVYDRGVLYKLSKNGTFTVLHSFDGLDGKFPYGTVAMDASGNFYGTTEDGGVTPDWYHVGWGTVWKVSTDGTETVLHSFAGPYRDGGYPTGGVVLDSKGNIYGTTEFGGANNDGTVWMLSRSRKLTLLHSFDASDGAYPYSEVLRDATGRLYGTTETGGSSGLWGTVWSYTP